MRKTVIISAMATLGMAVAAYAAAPDKTITAREANFKQIGRAFKGINDELKKPEPSLAVIRTNAAIVDALAPKLPRWFPKGSGPESGVKTDALPAIWTDKAGFAKAAGNLATAARALKIAAAGTDIAAMGKAFGATGGTCKGCHDSFKAKKQ